MNQKSRVLVSDKLSEVSLKIFEERGVDVDYQPGLGKNIDELHSVIPQYDGLAVRSATKVTSELLSKAENLKVIGRAGIGVDNIDVREATRLGVVVMNTPHGNSETNGRTCHCHAFFPSPGKSLKQVPQPKWVDGKSQDLWVVS